MDNQPSFDRSLLIPIGVAIFSLVGICAILVLGRVATSPAAVEDVPTSTPFQYAFIGTEPAISTLTTEEATSELPTEPPLAPETPTFGSPETPVVALSSTPANFPTNTLSSLITLPPLTTTVTPSQTPNTAFAAPLVGGTFDDGDSRFVYNGNWSTQTGVAGATGNTLHVSGTVGNSVKFLFIGNEMRVFFQAGPSLGTIRLLLDNTTSYVMNEASASTQQYEWVLSASNNGTHTVTITHESGGSVNFDAVVVPEIPATLTNTPTSH